MIIMTYVFQQFSEAAVQSGLVTAEVMGDRARVADTRDFGETDLKTATKQPQTKSGDLL